MNNISAISKYVCLAMAIAFASTSCTNDEEMGGQPSSNSSAEAGLYLKLNIPQGNSDTRSTMAIDYSLYEHYLQNLHMIIGNTAGSNAGNFKIIDFSSADVSPDGRILITSESDWKTIYGETSKPYHVMLIGNSMGLNYNDAGTEINSTSDSNLKVSCTKNTDGSYTIKQAGLNALLQATEKDDNIYKPYTGDANTGKTQAQTMLLMYGHKLWDVSTISDESNIYDIEVDMEHAAAKLYGAFTLSPTLLAHYEMVGSPTCTLTNYATTTHIANSGLAASDDNDVTYNYTDAPTLVTTTQTVPITETAEGKYVVNAYSYPYSWASGSNNAGKYPYFTVECTMHKLADGTDNSKDESFRFTVPLVELKDNATEITELKRNNIYKANIIWNTIYTTDYQASNADVTTTYEIASWDNEDVKDFSIKDFYLIEKDVAFGKADAATITINGFGWSSATLCDENKVALGESGCLFSKELKDNGYKWSKQTTTYSQMNDDIYVKYTNASVTVTPGGETKKSENAGDHIVFYIRDEVNGESVWYKFKINYVETVTTDDKDDVTITKETSAVKSVSDVENGYVAYAITLPSAVSDAILATPSETTDNSVSPAFVFVTSTTTGEKPTSITAPSGFSDYSSDWRLPTQNEIKFINAKLSTALSSDSKYWTYDGSVVNSKGETQSSATSAIAIAVHDISASKLAELLK